METIPNFPAYCATKGGRIWSLVTKRFLKLLPCHGYSYVFLQRGPKNYHKRVHRLVLETFIGPCPENMECCHNNGIRTDNRLKNLRWDTRKNNHKDAIKHGTHSCLRRDNKGKFAKAAVAKAKRRVD